MIIGSLYLDSTFICACVGIANTLLVMVFVFVSVFVLVFVSASGCWERGKGALVDWGDVIIIGGLRRVFVSPRGCGFEHLALRTIISNK